MYKWSQQAIGYISSVDIKRESNIKGKAFCLVKKKISKKNHRVYILWPPGCQGDQD
jgi:hypothetical protein